MAFTDTFLKRPVLSLSINIFIFCIGIFSCLKLPIRQFPQLTTAVITINTTYPGANAHTISGLITTPIETAIASAEGVDYIKSSSQPNLSTITCHLRLNANSETVLLDIINKVQQTSNLLPPGALRPVIEKKSDSATPLMYISLQSSSLSPQNMTDYAIRSIQPQLSNLEGVAKIDIMGGKKYALRIHLNPLKLLAYGLSSSDIMEALSKNQYITTAGQTKNQYIATPLSTNTDLHDLKAFRKMLILCHDGSSIRLAQVAKVFLGAESYDEEARFDGQAAIFLAVTPTPSANPLQVIERVRKHLPILESQYPQGLHSQVVYDATQYIHAALQEVLTTLFEAVMIVVGVLYLFLGSWRAVLVPILTIPLSLIGMGVFLQIFGCSINLLTLLAFVLAIGLVVDDAIVVVENIHRHYARHQNAWQACLEGSGEIAKAIVGMTITLAAVFAPITFSQGLTGSLFKEFALTLAGTVLLSGVIAITLSPLLNLKLLKPAHQAPFAFVRWFHTKLSTLEIRYFQLLSLTLQNRRVAIILVSFAVLLSPMLYQFAAHEIAPEEDQGFFFIVSTGQAQATKSANRKYVNQMDDILKNTPGMAHRFLINSPTPFLGLILKPWSVRDVSQFKLKNPLQEQLNHVTGLNTYAIIPPALPGGGDGAPFQMVLQSFGSIQHLSKFSDDLLQKAKETGLFIFINSSLKINQKHYELEIDREKANLSGLDMQQIGQMLSNALSENQMNYFALNDRRYVIIPRLEKSAQLFPEQIEELQLVDNQQNLIPLSNFIHLKPIYEPNAITHFQQASSSSLDGVLRPGVTMGQAIDTLKLIAKDVLPSDIHYDFAGQSRQFIQEQSSLLPIFILAVICIYLVLSIQYNSFRDPLIILTSLPLCFCAALLPLFFGLSTINIYTQIGLLTLVGLISKHGILIVDFANQLKEEFHYSVNEAVAEAARLRLRPILMTTAAMIFGVFPLLIADGAGAKSRMAIGLVITFGMSFGTLFTLFIVPSIYSLISVASKNLKDHKFDAANINTSINNT
jgi:multidrug efflux pump